MSQADDMPAANDNCRRRLPNRREHTVINFTTADGFTYAAGVSYFADGRLAEVFLNAEKIGTAIETAARDSAVVASLEASGPLGILLDLLAAEPRPGDEQP